MTRRSGTAGSYQYAENMSRVLELARSCLEDDGESQEPLLIYSFEDDVRAHNDELQESLGVEFGQYWRSVTEKLDKSFGKSLSEDGVEETFWVPMCGVGGVSSWDTDQGRLWVGYSHEDRELPYLLMVGKCTYSQIKTKAARVQRTT